MTVNNLVEMFALDRKGGKRVCRLLMLLSGEDFCVKEEKDKFKG